jgi:hypothetical protein
MRAAIDHTLATAELVVITGFMTIIAGSHLGMIWLADYYLYADRGTDLPISPEQIAGFAAIVCAVFAFFLRPALLTVSSGTLWLLLIFCILATLGEVFRPDFRPQNLTLYLGIVVAAIIGSAYGQIAVRRNEMLPGARVFFLIVLAWYAGLLFFYLRGDLGFFQTLEGASLLQRLSFIRGFSATEIPIWIGFHMPILLFFSRRVTNWYVKACIYAVIGVSSVLLLLTASIGALVAAGFVAFIYFSRRAFSVWRVAGVVIIVSALALGVNYVTQGELIASSESKLNRFDRGEGARTQVYTDLVDIISETPAGIGKGRYVEKNRHNHDGSGLYPHHNILGILAELGWHVGLVYTLIIALAYVMCARTLGLLKMMPFDTTHLRGLALAATAVFTYQQTRGMLHDTWPQKEIYLWLGVLSGMYFKLAAYKTAVTARQVTDTMAKRRVQSFDPSAAWNASAQGRRF